ncbi:MULTISPECIES: DUF6376 family protein [Bacillus]|uniref:DUF6376 family protein n=1 Tax=Bacillus TaxID=1386 RepID=UPI0007414BC8|nr:DUF6376 family protein [Bacillus licheniformis]KUL06633.1 hypothetical protein LI17339_20520 [Bacillus licheniformis LMG 17339]MDE1428735.1 DUF6376 family protein [Bacillus licheniformis]MEC1494777.1 DUF6376 family protein [Bacillus licheniformis]MED1631268.1 DUF6376 family protein [Bacillus licheniformis]OKS83718.1 hypothetical protein BFN05_04090 [Bacillus licheniformis]
MKRVLIVLAGIGLLGAGGCGMLDQVNDGLNYTNEAAGYIQKVKTFAEEAPSLAEQAVNDTGAKEKLETQLESIQQAAADFNELTPPDAAAEVHNTIEKHNETLQKSAEDVLKSVEEGKLTVEKLEQSELVQSAQQISDVMGQIEKLTE